MRLAGAYGSFANSGASPAMILSVGGRTLAYLRPTNPGCARHESREWVRLKLTCS